MVFNESFHDQQDGERYYTNGWIPSLWCSEGWLPDDQRLLCGSEEEGRYSSPNAPQPDFSCCAWGDQAQVCGHLIQVWTRTIPDNRGEAEVLWSCQGLRVQGELKRLSFSFYCLKQFCMSIRHKLNLCSGIASFFFFLLTNFQISKLLYAGGFVVLLCENGLVYQPFL